MEYTITYLEMTTRPTYPWPHQPGHAPLALLHAEKPPLWYFFSLYDAVGKGYQWLDMHQIPQAEAEAFVQDEKVALYTLIRTGWPAGFFVLDTRQAGICDLAYFGLVPQAIGLGLGTYLLHTAIHMAWDCPGVEKVSVNTCSLDHPRALPLYQAAGFEPVRQETRTR